MKPGISDYKFILDPVSVETVDTNYRTIKTKIPHPEDVKTLKTIMDYESSLISKQLPIVWDHADGFQVYDRWGNKWIDLSSTIFVANTGHASVKMQSRVKQTVDKGLLHSYCYPTQERADFLKKLIEITPSYLERASLITTGTEASERALKLARLYGMNFNPRKKILIGGIGNYHGKTMGAMMVAVNEEAREWIGNQDPDMYQLPFPYPWTLEEENLSGKELFNKHINKLIKDGMNPEEVAAFIIESYQGWGAVFYPIDYIVEMKNWAKKNNALIIADEIQSGFGRTGKFFAYEYYGIKPDLVVCGKAISGGLPISAVLGRSKLIDGDPTLTSTHGGHAMSCAGALGNLETLVEDKLVKRSSSLGKELHKWLIEWEGYFPDRIKLILGNGLLWAIFICDPKTGELDANFTDLLVERALQRGVFSIRTGCGTIKLGPPLMIEKNALREAIDVYVESMHELIDEGY